MRQILAPPLGHYLADLHQPVDPLIEEVRAAGIGAGLPLVEPETGRLLRALVAALHRAIGARDWHRDRLFSVVDGAGPRARRQADFARARSGTRGNGTTSPRARRPVRNGERDRRRCVPLRPQGGGTFRSDFSGWRQTAVRAAARHLDRSSPSGRGARHRQRLVGRRSGRRIRRITATRSGLDGGNSSRTTAGSRASRGC